MPEQESISCRAQEGEDQRPTERLSRVCSCCKGSGVVVVHEELHWPKLVRYDPSCFPSLSYLAVCKHCTGSGRAAEITGLDEPAAASIAAIEQMERTSTSGTYGAARAGRGDGTLRLNTARCSPMVDTSSEPSIFPNLAEAFRHAVIFYPLWSPALPNERRIGIDRIGIYRKAFSIAEVCRLVDSFNDPLPPELLNALLSYMDLRYEEQKDKLSETRSYRTGARCLSKLMDDRKSDYIAREKQLRKS